MQIEVDSNGLFQNDCFKRVLAPGVRIARFVLKNAAGRNSQTSISIFLDQIRARFDVFARFFTHKTRPILPLQKPAPIETIQPSLHRSHPSLQALYTPNTPLQLRHAQKITKFPSGIASPYTNPIFATSWYHPSLQALYSIFTEPTQTFNWRSKSTMSKKNTATHLQPFRQQQQGGEISKKS